MALRISQTVLALYGPTCVGKSTLASELGERLNVTVRRCGAVVRSRAMALSVDPNKLPAGIHQEIDDETRSLVSQAATALVVEGRFLDRVLAGVAGVRVIRLTCQEEIREARHRARCGDHTVQQHDETDARARELLYSHCDAGAEDWLVLDTSNATAGELADNIIAQLGS